MTDTAPPLQRELTNGERFTWGDCPVCHAKHGEWCDSAVGIPLGVSIGQAKRAHLGRLNNAPRHIRIVGADA